MYAFEAPKRTQQELLEEKEYNDYQQNCDLNPRGVVNHLLVGHGPELKDFEKRDIGTVKNLSYEDKQRANEITDSMKFIGENTRVDKFKINAKDEDIPSMFEAGLTSKDRIPKGYGEYTKKCDNNYAKTKLRK